MKWGTFAAALLASGCGREFEVPEAPSTRVTDKAGVMSPEARTALALRLQDYELRTKHQVWVYIDKKLPPRTTIEAFSLVSFNCWGVGRKGKDDGVVLFVFTEDRKLRIATGASLDNHKWLSDRKAARIIASMKPSLRLKKYDAAIELGVNAILVEVGGSEE